MKSLDRSGLTRRGMLLTAGMLGIGASSTLLGLSRALADTLADAKSRGELIVVTEMQFPPFDMTVNGEYQGLNRDLFDEVTKELGLKAKIIDLPGTGRLPGLVAKKFDLAISPVTITKERMKHFAFTLPISPATTALMRRVSDNSIQKPDDIKGKIVGGMKGTSMLVQLKEFAETLKPAVDVREYVDNNQSYADLAAGRIDAAVNSFPNLAYASAQRPDTFAVVLPPFGKPTYFSWAARLGEEDKSLLDAVNAALRKIKSDGRMARIQKKWLGQAVELPDSVPEPVI